IDYVFNKDKKQYIKDSDEYKKNINMLQVKPIENKEIKEDEYIYNTNVLTNLEAKEKLINIIDNYDNIEKMLKWFENQKNIVEVE
ncbi:hypothetical protein DP129_14210, partial [Clostridium tetani]